LSIFTRAADRPRNSCWRRADGHTIGREPCSQRYDEFVRIAAEAKPERERKKALRKRATIARRAIRVRLLNAVQKSIDIRMRFAGMLLAQVPSRRARCSNEYK
jgi:hypothetical protein